MADLSIEKTEILKGLDLTDGKNQPKMKDIVTDLEITTPDNKTATLAEVLKPFQDELRANDSDFVAESADVTGEDFNVNAYERVAFLTLDAKRRKGGRLSETEEKELKELKPIAYKNKGRTPIVTDTYKVAHKTVRLVEGLPTPESVFKMFSKYGQENLFS